MIPNSNSTTPPIRLNVPQESLIQFALKLKNVVSHVRLRSTHNSIKINNSHTK